jgi:hypothetical protein
MIESQYLPHSMNAVNIFYFFAFTTLLTERLSARIRWSQQSRSGGRRRNVMTTERFQTTAKIHICGVNLMKNVVRIIATIITILLISPTAVAAAGWSFVQISHNW